MNFFFLSMYEFILISIPLCILGNFLMVNKLVMFTNNIYHSLLLGLIITSKIFFNSFTAFYLCFSNIYYISVSSIIACLIVFFITWLTQYMLPNLDSNVIIAVTFCICFALTTMVISALFHNVHICITMLLGDISLICLNDVYIAFFVSIINLVIIVFLYEYYYIISVDSLFAKTIGINKNLIILCLLLQISMISISVINTIGIFILLSIISGIPVISRFYSNSFHKNIYFSIIFSIIAILLAYLLTEVLSYLNINASINGIYPLIIFICTLLTILIKNKSLFQRGN